MDTIDIHASRLVDWAICEKSEIQRHNYPKAAADEPMPHVATWMGSTVHAIAAGQEPMSPPKLQVYDDITPSLRHAWVQIDVMAAAVMEKTASARWEIIDRELTLPPMTHDQWPVNLRLVGRLDIKARQTAPYTMGILIADIKTAKEFAPAWIQDGAYGLMHEAAYGEDETVSRLAAVHCPRPKLPATAAKCEIYYCDAEAAMNEAFRIMVRIGDLLRDSELAYPAPGNRCRWCDHPNCVVRSQEFSPR